MIVIATTALVFNHYYTLIGIILPLLNFIQFIRLAKDDSESNKLLFYQLLVVTSIIMILGDIFLLIWRHTN